jgi:NTP pyrophosphatase (non-canonical NTP hydrolase)
MWFYVTWRDTLNPNEYQQLAKRTARQNFPDMVGAGSQMMNWLLGLAGEAGELCNLVKKLTFHKSQDGILSVNYSMDDWKKMVDELGDILWYVSQVADWLGVPLENVMSRNVEKLKARYPEQFPTDVGKDAHL